ncbi:MAG: alpha-galactosidase, partial [Kiritimatiellota bacterium]|nr:alpha-galactosidase [Kiritimatiellota bacterium]
EFNRVDEDVLKIRAGLELTRLRLHPGEEIRLPRILLVFWEGEPLTGHNLLRRFLVRHGTPRPGGQPPVTPVSFATWGGTPTSAHIGRIAELKAEHAGCDCYWMDAGWYGPKGTQCESVWSGGWAQCAGHWLVNPSAHPDGLRVISDAARKAGMAFILWLEPERAKSGMLWHKQHPEWFLGTPAKDADLLLNLGIPEARRFATDYISSLITREGVDVYRQDFNMGDPHPLWQAADAPDRLGLTEIKYVEGLYEFWDELLRRHPNLLIDNCAGGGRRIDIETIRRSIPLWRSDYQCYPEFDATGNQIHGIGLNYWIPFSATGTYVRPNDTYDFRSALAAGITLTPLINDANQMPKDYPWPWLRTMIAQLKRCRPAFAGDFYPLLSCSATMDNWTERLMLTICAGAGSDHQFRSAKDVWMAYQMYRDDLNEGFLVVFRRDQSPFLSAQLVLKGLDGNKRYMGDDAVTGEKREIGGGVLLSEGLLVQIPNPRESRLFFLRAL